MSLGHSLRGVHHIGITVEDMEKSFLFYTQVLGGTPIITGNGFKGAAIHNALLQKEELENSGNVPNLREGQDELDVRFIQFDNVVIELLQYHKSRAEGEQVHAYPAFHTSSSPACVASMHISFYLKDDVNVDNFVTDLESRAHEHGFDKVKCNRISMPGEAEVKKFEVDAPDNPFDGWVLVYCKGPSGEQLEFNQVLRSAKNTFDSSIESRRKSHS